MVAATITNQINAIIASVLSFSRSIAPTPIPRPDTLKGVDDLIRAGFEAYRGSCFNWLLAATGFVVVGLVFEGPELWHEITSIVRHWHFNRRFHFSLPEEYSPDWAKLLAFVGWVLIVVGVAGEYIADSFVSKADGYVQTFDEILLTEAQRGTAFARERAGAAYERAAQTEREAAEENARAAEAEKQASEENARAARALEAAEAARKNAEGYSLQIAQANERASKAELETERLRRQFADRALTDEQVVAIATKLIPFVGQEFEIVAYWENPESMAIANRVLAALNRAGWKYIKPAKGLWLMGGITGIDVDVFSTSSDSTKKAAEMLVSVLHEQRLAAKLSQMNDPKNADDKIHFSFGTKQ